MVRPKYRNWEANIYFWRGQWSFNTSTPEKAFKTSVRPLGGLFVLQSLCLLYVFSTWPADLLAKAPLPFVPDPGKKYFLIASAISILIIGIGLFTQLSGFIIKLFFDKPTHCKAVSIMASKKAYSRRSRQRRRRRQLYVGPLRSW